MNVRDSFLPGEESRWVWEQTKRQIYRMVFHRMVSLDIKNTLDDILQMLLRNGCPEYHININLGKLYNTEMISNDILGYKNAIRLATTEDVGKNELKMLQKLLDKGQLSPLLEDEEELVAKVILAEDPTPNKEPDKEKDDEPDKKSPFKENEALIAKLEYPINLEKATEKLAEYNKKTFNTFNLFRNKSMFAFREKLQAIENCIDMCSMMITNAPGTLAKS